MMLAAYSLPRSCSTSPCPKRRTTFSDELKADPLTSKIPVIVMSVVDRPDLPDGVDAHVGKPVQHDPLLRVLEEHAAAPSDGQL